MPERVYPHRRRPGCIGEAVQSRQFRAEAPEAQAPQAPWRSSDCKSLSEDSRRTLLLFVWRSLNLSSSVFAKQKVGNACKKKVASKEHFTILENRASPLETA